MIATELRAALNELGVPGLDTPAPVGNARQHIEKALELAEQRGTVTRADYDRFNEAKAFIEEGGEWKVVPTEGPPIGGLFVNRDSGAVVRVTKVDESYAYIEQINGKGRWAQPIADYNETFASVHRHARLEDLTLASEEYAAPTNTEAWAGSETY